MLIWLQDDNVHKQFLSNRVQKIRQQSFLQWNYVLTAENSADIGSRGCKRIDIENSWTSGPTWLPDRGNWPKQITIQGSQESDNERKAVKEIFKIAVSLGNTIPYQLLERFNLKKTLTILSWVHLSPSIATLKNERKGARDHWPQRR